MYDFRRLQLPWSQKLCKPTYTVQDDKFSLRFPRRTVGPRVSYAFNLPRREKKGGVTFSTVAKISFTITWLSPSQQQTSLLFPFPHPANYTRLLSLLFIIDSTSAFIFTIINSHLSRPSPHHVFVLLLSRYSSENNIYTCVGAKKK